MQVERVERLSVSEVSAMDRDRFVAAFGGVFENAPWVAGAAWESRPFADLPELHERMCEAVAAAPPERRLALIVGHPELAGREAAAGELSDASADEQASARLDRLDGTTLSRLRDLNGRYREKFGFPCVLCVREHGSVQNILAAMERRLRSDRATEIATCIDEIGRIGRLRLEQLVSDNGSGS